ncbi:MAG: dCMP deaminase family protein [Bacilli bacterium]|nr:dCMP deaminase family protein [Bacilli bacterium]MDD3304757.1 dCMP deaminase family protein [Bacilli bacterium]MDD4053779.1 dCMP deaminase family protein [Bacilli bacterium]MDD4411647.1 dCMP deaminase family protein [Bacilli bacterium]
MLDASKVIYKKLNDLEVNCSDKSLITWDEAFIGLSKIVAMRSKDPNTQVGACIVDEKHRIISLGYNGLPFGCDDKCFPWGRDSENVVDTKYPYVVHAEVNAISIAQTTSPRDLSNSTIYLSLFPCNNCAAKIIQAGISEVLYVLDKYADTDAYRASKRMLDEAGVVYRRIDDVDITVKGYNKTIKR